MNHDPISREDTIRRFGLRGFGNLRHSFKRPRDNNWTADWGRGKAVDVDAFFAPADLFSNLARISSSVTFREWCKEGGGGVETEDEDESRKRSLKKPYNTTQIFLSIPKLWLQSPSVIDHRYSLKPLSHSLWNIQSCPTMDVVLPASTFFSLIGTRPYIRSIPVRKSIFKLGPSTTKSDVIQRTKSERLMIDPIPRVDTVLPQPAYIWGIFDTSSNLRVRTGRETGEGERMKEKLCPRSVDVDGLTRRSESIFEPCV
ncbi:hypothetical protein EV360DRAFT_74287 [Lentinula raphanica]|nr:hypothetical protein EV360DRAFT_74287 [Lentinula raphanica]